MAPPTVLTDAEYWYDAEDVTSGSQQTIPNQGTAGTSNGTLGPTSGSESSDPTWASDPNRLQHDGTDDYLLFPDNSPESYLTPTTGKFSFLLVISPDAISGTKGIMATSGSTYAGVAMYRNSSGNYVVRIKGSATVDATAHTSATADEIIAVGGVCDEGSVQGYHYGTGLGTAGDYSGMSSLSFSGDKLAVFSGRNNSSFATEDGNWYALVTWDQRALTETEFDDTAEYLLDLRTGATATPATITATTSIPTNTAGIGAAPATTAITIALPAPTVTATTEGNFVTMTLRDTGHTVTAKGQT